MLIKLNNEISGDNATSRNVNPIKWSLSAWDPYFKWIFSWLSTWLCVCIFYISNFILGKQLNYFKMSCLESRTWYLILYLKLDVCVCVYLMLPLYLPWLPDPAFPSQRLRQSHLKSVGWVLLTLMGLEELPQFEHIGSSEHVWNAGLGPKLVDESLRRLILSSKPTCTLLKQGLLRNMRRSSCS